MNAGMVAITAICALVVGLDLALLIIGHVLGYCLIPFGAAAFLTFAFCIVEYRHTGSPVL